MFKYLKQILGCFVAGDVLSETMHRPLGATMNHLLSLAGILAPTLSSSKRFKCTVKGCLEEIETMNDNVLIVLKDLVFDEFCKRKLHLPRGGDKKWH